MKTIIKIERLNVHKPYLVNFNFDMPIHFIRASKPA